MSIQTLYSVAIASSLLGHDVTNFANLDLSSVRLYAHRWSRAIFTSLQRCSIGFKSGYWLGHSRIFTELILHCLCCVLRVIVLLEGESQKLMGILKSCEQALNSGLI